jgi:hypothetical protein
MWIYVKIYADLFFEGRFKFGFQRLNKLTYPPFTSVILLAVTDEDVIFVTRDEACHGND